jgi:hypothetical protein
MRNRGLVTVNRRRAARYLKQVARYLNWKLHNFDHRLQTRQPKKREKFDFESPQRARTERLNHVFGVTYKTPSSVNISPKSVKPTNVIASGESRRCQPTNNASLKGTHKTVDYSSPSGTHCLFRIFVGIRGRYDISRFQRQNPYVNRNLKKHTKIFYGFR